MEIVSIVMMCVDFGLLVLIWLVQLVIYPSFCTYSDKEELWRWHSVYMQRISYVVIPLMIGQLALSGILLFTQFSYIHLCHLLLVMLVWLLTFIIFVPLHQRVLAKEDFELCTQQLVKKNWWRTTVWSLLFLVSLFNLLNANLMIN